MSDAANRRDYDVVTTDERLLLLREAARLAWLDGDYEWMQELNWTTNWLRCGGTGEPPQQWNPSDERHRKAVRRLVEEFLAVATRRGPFQGCLYRPAAELPYGRSQIEAALRTHFAKPGEHPQLIDALALLHGFVDVPADELPTDPAANLAHVHERTDEHLAA